MTAPAGWVDDGKLLPRRELWVFVGRTADGQSYLWRRADVPTDATNIATGYCQTVASFWPKKPTWKVSIREGSIIANLFGFLRGSTPQQRTFVNGVDASTAVHPGKATP